MPQVSMEANGQEKKKWTHAALYGSTSREVQAYSAK